MQLLMQERKSTVRHRTGKQFLLLTFYNTSPPVSRVALFSEIAFLLEIALHPDNARYLASRRIIHLQIGLTSSQENGL
jgi:hypothetical protein